MTKRDQSYDFICFSNLAYEFSLGDKTDIEKSIKRKLKYYNLGPYIQEKVDYIRQLKNELYLKINQCAPKYYYRNPNSKFADPKDFNFELLVNDYLKKYPQISKEDMGGIVNFAIYLYYLR